MTAFLIYTGKVAVLLAVFYLFYRLLMERETFHRLNRAVLLLSALASFVLPFCVITTHQVVQVAATIAEHPATAPNIQPSTSVYWPIVLMIIYLTGLTAKLLHIILAAWRLHRFISQCEKHPQKDGITVAVSSQDIAPFSWWNTIVLSRKDYEFGDPALIAHERAHIEGYHSVDILLMEMLLALQWFNPAAWLMSRDLHTVHEYEADASVLARGGDVHHYLMLLMERANVQHPYPLANSISQKSLKGRFQMMARKHSKPMNVFRLLYVLPVIACTLALNARTITDIEYMKANSPVEKTVAPQPNINLRDKDSPIEKKREKAKTSETGTESVTVSGTVVDIDGTPIVGAIVVEHDSHHGTVSDFDGHFNLSVPRNARLDVMYVGVATESVICKHDMADIQITLKPDESDKKE